MDHRCDVNGTVLFLDERGPADGPPLLFVHGGPGNSCWDFMSAVGDELAARGIRVLGVDQRGVLRSDSLLEGAELTVNVLIDDFEALRRALGIDEWTILGHSAGGGYALDYALSHPDSVSGLILDCPCLDADATDRFRLPRAAALLQDVGKTSEAEKCVALAASPRRLTGGDRSWEVMQALGDRYLDLFVAGREGRARYERLIGRAPEDLDWAKGVSHLPLLHDMYRDRTPSLSSLSVPSVLLHGEGDLVAAPSVIEAYRAATGGDVVTIPDAGHFSYIEQPRAYVEAVAGFMNAPKCRAA